MMTVVQSIPDDQKDLYNRLIKALESSMQELKRSCPDGKVGVAFSGGLDSSIIGYLAMRHLRPTFYVVGFKGSKDVRNAIDSFLRMFGEHSMESLRVIYITDDDVVEALKEFSKLGLEDILIASFEVPLYITLKHSKESIIISGQGADELFGGYKKYLENPSLMRDDFKRLLEVTVPFEDKLAKIFNKRIIRPYLMDAVISIAKELSIEEKIYEGIRKLALRRVAYLLSLPWEIITREKKAAQYGSGVMKSIRKIARSLGVDLRDVLKVLSNEST